MKVDRLLLPVWQHALIVFVIEGKDELNICTLVKKANISRCHVHNLIGVLERLKLVVTRKLGRCRFISVTLEGKNIAESLLFVYKQNATYNNRQDYLSKNRHKRHIFGGL